MIHDVLIVGGGIAGLSLARELVRRGRAPVVLERARGVGGRCATRRIDGQPVDHGVAVLHGVSPAFRAEVAAVGDTTGVVDWPRTVADAGATTPHAPFEPHTPRVVPVDGVNQFARHLAGGLDVRLGSRVEALALAPAPDAAGRRIWRVAITDGEPMHARTLVLAVPPPSIRALLETVAADDAAIAALLRRIAPVDVEPCLTVIARYAAGTPVPEWDVSLPAAAHPVERLLHDSSKRVGAPRLTLVIQARPEFSRAHLAAPPDDWARLLLDAAAALHGSWIASPELMQSHRWGFARVVPGAELDGPVVAPCAGAAVVGLAGDGFHPAGGVEGAFLSGHALAAALPGLSTTMGTRGRRALACPFARFCCS